MRIEYEKMQPGSHCVLVVDDGGRRWRTDVRVDGDITADDGRSLAYRGVSIAGRLPRAALEAVLIEEFPKAGFRTVET